MYRNIHVDIVTKTGQGQSKKKTTCSSLSWFMFFSTKQSDHKPHVLLRRGWLAREPLGVDKRCFGCAELKTASENKGDVMTKQRVFSD